MAIIDVSFPIMGTTIPVDHGYLLFSAISGKIPKVHESSWSIHPILGALIGNRQMQLTKRSRLVLRLDHSELHEILSLAGKALQVGENQIRLGVPYLSVLHPNPRCWSRLVVIKGFMEPEGFLAAAQRQLDEQQIKGRAKLVKRKSLSGNEDPFIRRTLKIKDQEIVGYALEVDGLSPEDSLKLQEMGVGGRHHMGCGVFNPARVRHE